MPNLHPMRCAHRQACVEQHRWPFPAADRSGGGCAGDGWSGRGARPVRLRGTAGPTWRRSHEVFYAVGGDALHVGLLYDREQGRLAALGERAGRGSSCSCTPGPAVLGRPCGCPKAGPVAVAVGGPHRAALAKAGPGLRGLPQPPSLRGPAPATPRAGVEVSVRLLLAQQLQHVHPLLGRRLLHLCRW